MIDYVKLKYRISIPNNYFSSQKWKKSKTEDGQPFYWYTLRGVKLHYYTESELFTINGKILMLLHDTQVQNFDDIYGGERDLFLNEINEVINRRFPSPILDIRNFTVSKIDYCVNVETPYVEEYIDFLSRAFQMTNKGARVDYAGEHCLTGSVYVKTASDYNADVNKNYTLNFYSKADRLNYLVTNGVHVSDSDFALAENVLRLEVQCGHQLIKQQLAKFQISNTFGELFDFRIAYDTIFSVYQRVFKGNFEADYFTYGEAKKLLNGHVAAQNTLYVASSHKILGSKYAYGRKQAMTLGVYPYCFLDKKGTLSSLENPMKLLYRKLSVLGVLSK